MVSINNIVPVKTSAMISLKETADDTFPMDTNSNICVQDNCFRAMCLTEVNTASFVNKDVLLGLIKKSYLTHCDSTRLIYCQARIKMKKILIWDIFVSILHF